MNVYDPEERAREKQASRDADSAAIASGAKTVEQVRRANSMLPWAELGARVDWSQIPHKGQP